MQFFPAFSHLISLGSTYSPKHPVLKHPQNVFLLQIERQVSHPYKTTGKIKLLIVLIFTF
jgi:hypothetical protein